MPSPSPSPPIRRTRDRDPGRHIGEPGPRGTLRVTVGRSTLPSDGLTHHHPEFQQLAVNPRGTPPRIRLRHRANQRADVRRHRRSTDTAAALPRPEQAEPLAMPRDDRLRFDDDERHSPLVPDTRERDPEHAVSPPETQPVRDGATAQAPAAGGATRAPRLGARTVRAHTRAASEGARRGRTSSTTSASGVRRNINVCKKNGIFSRDRRHQRAIVCRRVGPDLPPPLLVTTSPFCPRPAFAFHDAKPLVQWRRNNLVCASWISGDPTW